MRKLRKRTSIAILVGLLLLLWLVYAPVYQAKDQVQSTTVSRSDLILAMNTLRVSNGLPALIVDPIVNAVAQNTAEIMAANNMSWHIGDVSGRIAAAGYGGGATVWATENFAVGWMSIDEIMLVWSDYDHMRPATNPAYCHVGAGVAQTADGKNYYILQAAYISGQACGEYKLPEGFDDSLPSPPISQIIIPVKVATPDAEGRIYHIVQAGQSFWSVAIAYKVTIRDLEVWNNLRREDGLFVGQKLFIPSANTEGYATPTPVGMVLLSDPDAEGKIVHEVQPYQTLIRIAQAYNVSLDTILRLNAWQVDWPLQIGQRLLIDPGRVTPSPTPRPLTAIEKLTPASDGNYYHTVASGEYLAWIAELYEVKLADLMAWNGLSSDSIIRPGEKLLLRVTPPASDTPTPAPPSATPTVTLTTAARTPTQTLSATQESITTPTSTAARSGTSGMTVPLVVVLAVAGLLALAWALRRK